METTLTPACWNWNTVHKGDTYPEEQVVIEGEDGSLGRVVISVNPRGGGEAVWVVDSDEVGSLIEITDAAGWAFTVGAFDVVVDAGFYIVAVKVVTDGDDVKRTIAKGFWQIKEQEVELPV